MIFECPSHTANTVFTNNLSFAESTRPRLAYDDIITIVNITSDSDTGGLLVGVHPQEEPIIVGLNWV